MGGNFPVYLKTSQVYLKCFSGGEVDLQLRYGRGGRGNRRDNWDPSRGIGETHLNFDTSGIAQADGI